MAHCNTDLPKHIGERDLAQQLILFNDPKLHIWFGLDFIPGVRDIDILIWHEDAGVFIVEVKAVSLAMIEEFGWKYCKIKDRPVSAGPQYQAHEAQESLYNYLAAHMKRPYISSTACWPLISRDDWNRMWDDDRVKYDYADRMLFQEDLFTGAEDFVNRLKHIWHNPPVRTGASYAFHHSAEQLEHLKALLSPAARPKPAPSDLERLHALEKRVLEETSDEAPPGQGVQLLYQGYPGTGKTFRLLAIALRHAIAHERTLFICFNKVLAADIRRLLSYSQTLRQFNADIEVIDLYHLLRKLALGASLDLDSAEDAEAWGELIADEVVRTADRIEKYDTILIDEAQDLHDWAFDMLQAMTNPQATICVAVGKGQELYTSTPRWLEAFRKVARLKQLRRNFRNTLPVFQMAQVFYEAGLDQEKIARILQRFTSSKEAKDGDVPEFERPDGQTPLLLRMNDTPTAPVSGMLIFDEQETVMRAEYERIIRQQLDGLTGDMRPLDLLVLVPDTKGLERAWALAALRSLRSQRQDFEIIDYTDDRNRRTVAASNTIRLCTFHSSRGLEAMRVIIFGFEFIERTAQKVNVAYNNLGYITLSRSLFEDIIAVRGSARSTVIPFLETTIRALRQPRRENPQQRLF